MESHSLLIIFVLLNFALGGSHATRTKEELHWMSVFPHTPMPSVLQQILPIPGQKILFKFKDDSEQESNDEDIPNDPIYGAYWYDYGYKENDHDLKNKDSPQNKHVNDDQFGLDFVGDSSEQEPKTPNDPEFDNNGYHDHTNYNDQTNKLVNRKALRGTSRSHEDETIFFFQENLLPGTKVNLPRFLSKADTVKFLPRQIAESMSMSNEELPQILKNFSLKAESKGVDDVKVAVMNCERSEMKGETKYCATSLESFVDSSVSMLGKNIKLLSHELEKEVKTPFFTIGQGVQNMGENNIVCHKMKYPYALYLCHSIEKTDIYKVPLVSKYGTKVKALAACHKDTSAWNPNHIAMRFLKVKPGTCPICHFLSRDTLVWIPY